MELSPTSVICREVFDENSLPSAEEISEYAQQIGIDPESESHLLPLARDGLMQAVPEPWTVYYDETVSVHYYYNQVTRVTQWEHPLDEVYRELVKKARDASIHDDTCASVQELLTYEENPRQADAKNDSDDDCLLTDSDVHSDTKDKRGSRPASSRRLTPLGLPPRAPIIRPIDKKLSDLRISPPRKSSDGILKPSQNDAASGWYHSKLMGKAKPSKQKPEKIDLKIHVLNSPEEKSFNLLSSSFKDKSLALTGKGEMFTRAKKTDLFSPDSLKSFTQDSGTKTDTPKGILRDTNTDFNYKTTDFTIKSTASYEDDKKIVRFQLENPRRETTVSPSSNSSSDQNEGASSIISAPPSIPPVSPLLSEAPLMSPSVPSLPTFKNNVPNYPKKLAPLSIRPMPLQMERTGMSAQVVSDIPKEESAENIDQLSPSPKRRLLRPQAADYIKPDLFLKSFQKISDIVKSGDNDGSSASIDEPIPLEKDKEKRPRSPMIPPQKNKISINLMESIDSDSSLDSPDKEIENLNLDETMDDLKGDSHERLTQLSDHFTEEFEAKNQYKQGAKLISPRLDSLNAFPEKLSEKHSDESIKYPKETPSSRSSSFDKATVLMNPIPRKASPFNLMFDYSPPKLDSPTRPGWPSYKPALNKPTHLKTEVTAAIGKGLGSPKIDGVIISQGKSFNKDSDNVVVMFQFEPPPEEDTKKAFNNAQKETVDLIKTEEKTRLEALLQSELDGIRAEWANKEGRIKEETLEEIRSLEKMLEEENKRSLRELSEVHNQNLEEAKLKQEELYAEGLRAMTLKSEERYRIKCEAIEREYEDRMIRIRQEQENKLSEERNAIELENERILRDFREQTIVRLEEEKAHILEETQLILSKLHDENTSRVKDLKEDYRAEVDRLRNQHACHLEEIRARLAGERAAAAKRGVSETQALGDKYKCLKEKYARLKRDVRLSIERRNKRREMSLTTGSETEKSNSHKGNQPLEKCKEANESTVSATNKAEPPRTRPNNNATKFDNETSLSESHANKSLDNNNFAWKERQNEAKMVLSPETSRHTSGAKPPPLKVNRRATVAFREPQKKRRSREKERDAGTSDCQDSSDPTTTADDKPKISVNGHGRRRCFTRLKSASTSRLNYSPKRGEGWSSPLEALRQQLRKLDDLEDQFPDLAGQNSYSLRYPFAELGDVATAETPEVEFVRHRALIEREGMRRARAVLRRRKAALAETRSSTEPYPLQADDKDTTELEVALHRARALLGEKEIRLRHIERSLHRIADSHLATNKQEECDSDDSSDSSVEGEVASGAVLRSLRALHADVRDIWLALDARPTLTASPETSSCNAVSPQPRASLSAAEPLTRTTGDANVTERAKGLRAWLQSAP